ncbi:hypothetical protein E3N88_37467 [Mikania micrantha]|uniref:Uncharacterized protein n=1 Tax=Mikania micrantha TaxID=192012 RepID=A0A5N6LRD6_9ASTR|nr:hypothetical protein E3N88_37467 [Mikania micrantha]
MDENEWETIQPSTSASQSDLSDSDADVVVLTTPTNFNNLLDPTNHQESPLDDHHLQEPPPSSHSSSTTPYTTEIADDELPQPSDVTDTRLNASLGILGSWVLRIGYGMRSRIGFWSLASVGAFVALVAYARRWQRWRRLKDDTDKLLNLLNQKDELLAANTLLAANSYSYLFIGRAVVSFRMLKATFLGMESQMTTMTFLSDAT